MLKKRLVGVYGVSGFGREIMPLVENQISLEKDESFKTQIVFIDDFESEKKNNINGHEVLTWNDFLKLEATKKEISIAISNNKTREKLAKKILTSNINLLTICASSSKRLLDVELGEGSIITDGCIFTSNIKIGKCFHSNLNSYIGHDCIISDFVTFAPSVKCNGNVNIGKNVYIGTGAIIKQGKANKPLIIGENAKIEAGSYVTKNVEANSTVLGYPAKKLTLSLLRSMYG